jgi:PD-(D/E)XK nuclease superfamily
MSFDMFFFDYFNGDFMNFFSSIQQASMEKSHSAAIAWLASPNNARVTQKDRLKFLSMLTGVKLSGNIVRSTAEYDGIDILIEMDDVIIAIENKIKISEHSNQLDKYNKILNEKFAGYKHEKMFLSLAGESASDKEWKSIDYEDFFQALKEIENPGEIISDYISNLSCLVSAKNDFEKDHTKYKNVFVDGAKRKSNAKSESIGESARYISDNGLETIFQKIFFHKLIKDLDACDDVDVSARLRIIGETRGRAFIDLKNPGLCECIFINGCQVDLGLQIQGNSIKIQFENGLDEDGRRKENSENIRHILDKNMPIIFKRHFNESKWSLNKPTNSNSAYYSCSRKIKIDQKETGILYALPYVEIFDLVKSALKDCYLMVEDIKTSLNDV